MTIATDRYTGHYLCVTICWFHAFNGAVFGEPNGYSILMIFCWIAIKLVGSGFNHERFMVGVHTCKLGQYLQEAWQKHNRLANNLISFHVTILLL